MGDNITDAVIRDVIQTAAIIDPPSLLKEKTPGKRVTSSTQKLSGSDQNQCNKLITKIADKNWDIS